MFRSLPAEKKQEIRQILKNFHDRMFETFQGMPACMVLVMRNLNKFRGGLRGLLAKFSFEMSLLWDFIRMYSLSVGL